MSPAWPRSARLERGDSGTAPRRRPSSPGSPWQMSLRPFLPGPRGEFGTRSLRLPHSPDAAYCSGRTGIACTPSSLEPIAGGPRGRHEESAEFRLFAAPPPPPPPPAEETAKDTLCRVERPGARPQSRFATGGSAQPRRAPPRRPELAYWPRGTVRRSPAAAHLGAPKYPVCGYRTVHPRCSSAGDEDKG